MSRLTLKILLISTLTTLASSAYADTIKHYPSSVFAKNFYGGVSIGQSKLNTESSTSNNLNAMDFGGKDTTYKIFAGYPLTRYLAVEGFIANFGKFTEQKSGAKSSFEGGSLGVDALASTSLNDVSLFAKLGYQQFAAKSSYHSQNDSIDYSKTESNGNITYGLGLSYLLVKNVSVRAEWERYVKDSNFNVDTFTVGTAYMF